MKSNNYKIITPLRYPGGKTRVIEKIFRYFPKNFDTYVEPFLGGGSVLLTLVQIYPDKKFIANDINNNLYCFWTELKYSCRELINALLYTYDKIVNNDDDYIIGLEQKIKNILYNESSNNFDKACAYYINNKCVYGGIEERKFLSKKCVLSRFNKNNILKLKRISHIIQNVEFYNKDYRDILFVLNSFNNFIYLDPPYDILDRKLYGIDGRHSMYFEHNNLLKNIKNLRSKIVISYNDINNIDDTFNLTIKKVEVDYSLKNNKYSYNNIEFIITNEKKFNIW